MDSRKRSIDELSTPCLGEVTAGTSDAAMTSGEAQPPAPAAQSPSAPLGGPPPIMVTEKLLGYMQSKLAESCSSISPQPSQALCRGSEEVAKDLLTALLNDAHVLSIVAQHTSSEACGWTNPLFSAAGHDLSRAIKLLPPPLLQGLLTHSQPLADAFRWYYAHLETSKLVYSSIQEHHKVVQQKDWQAVTADAAALSTYQVAASAMGAKAWVAEANEWMASYCERFFCRGGAAKHYMKQLQQQQQTDTKDASYWQQLHASLTPALCSAERKIRLLDVGSCYNPLAKLETCSKEAFAITAMDLCPGDASVLQGDFLQVAVGPEMVVTALSTPQQQQQVLAALPAGGYDAITMSLVLSYLPHPAAREAMVYKAKQLLASPDSSGSGSAEPHHTGILVIIEKQSILSASAGGGAGGGPYPDTWKQAITAIGFTLVNYQALPTSDGRKCHAFVFANTSSAAPRMMLPVDGGDEARMWIKQDTYYGGSGHRAEEEEGKEEEG